jgi:hypothetical protein
MNPLYFFHSPEMTGPMSLYTEIENEKEKLKGEK